MQWSKLSVCYYPTTVILLDDKQSFLDELQLSLDGHIISKSFSNSKKFLDYIENEYKPDPFVNKCLTYDEENIANHIVADVDIKAIHTEIYNPNRFNQISVIIADYSMPYINGLECCEKIQDKLSSKILLTGEADIETAVNAFNQGIINKFIQKSNPNLKLAINQAVSELQVKYFEGLTEKLYSSVKLSISKCLSDPVFIKFFESLLNKEKIIEYYLVDNYGSFLLIDMNGNPKWLVVKSDNDIEELLQIAELADATSELLDTIKTRQKIPYFHTEKDMLTPPAEWNKFMHDAHVLKGNINYYYAFIDNVGVYDIDRNKIITYQSYINTI